MHACCCCMTPQPGVNSTTEQRLLSSCRLYYDRYITPGVSYFRPEFLHNWKQVYVVQQSTASYVCTSSYVSARNIHIKSYHITPCMCISIHTYMLCKKTTAARTGTLRSSLIVHNTSCCCCCCCLPGVPYDIMHENVVQEFFTFPTKKSFQKARPPSLFFFSRQ